jgi:glucose-1-phosphate adenylyltransferase
MGIYIFNRKLLFDLLQNENKDSADFGKEIIPQSINKYKVASYQYEGYWEDIGNIKAFYDANLSLTNEIPDFNLYDVTHSIYTRPRMLPPVKYNGSTHTSHSLIAEGCIINSATVERCVVGIRSRIGLDSYLSNTYLMGNDYYESLEHINIARESGTPLIGIGERCVIQGAIIDKDCRIGNDVKISGGTHLSDTDNKLYAVKDGVVVIKKGAILPDGFTIGQ